MLYLHLYFNVQVNNRHRKKKFLLRLVCFFGRLFQFPLPFSAKTLFGLLRTLTKKKINPNSSSRFQTIASINEIAFHVYIIHYIIDIKRFLTSSPVETSHTRKTFVLSTVATVSSVGLTNVKYFIFAP